MKLPILQKPSVETKRLTLKPYSKGDAQALARLITNREIAKTFMVPDFETMEAAAALADKLISFSQPEDTRHLEYGIYLGDTLIGFVNDCGVEGDAIEIGYVIHPDYQGRGYGTEAVRAVLGELREMGFKKVTAGFFTENTPSRRVMEKCGMKESAFTDQEEYRGVLHECRYFEICF